ncbi:MAG: META domain-containing protein [Pyrinomonadaceae bacterium]
MFKRRINIVFTSILLVFTAIAVSAQELPKGEWKLTAYNFRQKIAFPIDKMNVTLNIKGSSLGGRSGCNVYGGDYAFEDNALNVGDLMSTMMACQEPAMQFERIFLDTLKNSTEFSLEDDQLTVTDPKTASFLRFERAKVFKCGTVTE